MHRDGLAARLKSLNGRPELAWAKAPIRAELAIVDAELERHRAACEALEQPRAALAAAIETTANGRAAVNAATEVDALVRANAAVTLAGRAQAKAAEQFRTAANAAQCRDVSHFASAQARPLLYEAIGCVKHRKDALNGHDPSERRVSTATGTVLDEVNHFALALGTHDSGPLALALFVADSPEDLVTDAIVCEAARRLQLDVGFTTADVFVDVSADASAAE